MSKNVLVVDDDPNVVEIITESLENKGYCTERAFDGVSAIEKYDEFHPDLVLLDIALPRKDGFSVCNEIRAKDSNSDVPVIMISGNSIPDNMTEGFRSGAQDYIKKPFSVSEVLAKIDNFLLQADGMKNLREQNEILEGELLRGHEDYERVNRELKKKVLDMRTLFDLSQDLNRHRDPDDLINVFSLTLIGQLGMGAVSFFYADQENDTFYSYAGGKGIKNSILKTVRFSKEVGLSEYLFANRDILDLSGEELPEDVQREVRFMRDLGFAICYPLVMGHKMLGIVFVGQKVSGQEYSANDLELFRSICNSAATGLENARLYTELQSTYLSTIKVLISTIEAKDSYTRGHTERVASYAVMIADELGMDKDQKATVSFGAALHDIGKLAVYETILNKPGDLTENEWEVIKSHPEVGANIIKDMKFLESACDLVKHHHERLDGMGYPDGLKGDEISIGARIVAVADSFDAMTSNRSYRTAYEFDQAIQQLKSQYNKFDQKVVDSLVRCIDKGLIRP